jgi:hypothetical protein
MAIADAYTILGNDFKRQEYDRQRIQHSTSHLSRPLRPRPSTRTYGVHDPRMKEASLGPRRRATQAPGSHFNYDAHYQGHFGSASTLKSAEQEKRKQKQDLEAWRAELERGRAHTSQVFLLGVGLSIMASFAVFYH